MKTGLVNGGMPVRWVYGFRLLLSTGSVLLAEKAAEDDGTINQISMVVV